MKKIVLTGGGTAGHVTPNIALFPHLKDEGYELFYIGSKDGIEKELVEKEGVKFFSIHSGMLRRYFDLDNVKDAFRVIAGTFESLNLLRKIKPDIVFSKGGYVAVPVVYAARFYKIPVILHESDITPGLANKMCFKFAKKICLSFEETIDYVPKEKGIFTGTPIRESIFKGKKHRGYEFAKLDNKKPVLMAMGGSQGAGIINDYLRQNLSELLKKFHIIHLTGKDNLDKNFDDIDGYRQYEYLHEELFDVFAISDMLISRAGSNSIYEILELEKPNLLIPLNKKISRGDQILNAKSFEKSDFSSVILEEDLTNELFCSTVIKTYNERDKYIKNMKFRNKSRGIKNTMDVILENTKCGG